MQFPNKDATFNVFSREFQDSILDCLLKDQDFLKRFCTKIKPRHFIEDRAKAIATIVLTFYETYRRQPTLAEVTNQVYKQYPHAHQKPTVDEYAKFLTNSYARALPDTKYVTSQLQEFVQQAELSEVLWQTAQNFSAANLDLLKSKLTDISRLNPLDNDIGTSSSDFASYLLAREEDPPGVQTTFMSMDRAFGGALQPGELLVIMAPTNMGKTHTLVNLGRGMLCAGNNVLHITIGDMYLNKVTERYIQSMTNMSIQEISSLHMFKEVARLLNDYQVMTDKTMRIKYYNGNTLSVPELESFMIELRDVHKFKTDALIIDYADLMKPKNSKLEKRHQLSELYVDLRSLGNNFGVPVITASQTNRQGALINYDPKTKKKLHIPQALSAAHIGEDWSKAATADYIISLRAAINYSRLAGPNEKILQMDLTKSRNSAVDQIFYFKADFARSRLDEFDIDVDHFEAELSGKPLTVNDMIT